MSTKKINGLEIDEDFEYQKRAWVRQRIGWIFMLLLLIAAVLGLLGGHGPLNKAQAGQAGGELWVEYARFIRLEGPATLYIHLGKLSGEDTVRLSIDGNYLRKIQVENIEPEPIQQYAATDMVIYEFAVDPATTETEVRFDIKPERFGRLMSPIAKVGGPTVTVKSFVYP